VANPGKRALASVADEYIRQMMSALACRATRRRHTNVLMHLLGFLKNKLDKGGKQEMLEIIDGYRLGQYPRVVPIMMLRHHFRRYPDKYVCSQNYLYPDELEFRLRLTENA
jgi:uncharacterized protein YbgA (DUF1722 family)